MSDSKIPVGDFTSLRKAKSFCKKMNKLAKDGVSFQVDVMPGVFMIKSVSEMSPFDLQREIIRILFLISQI